MIAKLAGGSYRLESVRSPGRFEKKHSSDLSPYPLQLVPFEPTDGPDTRFSEFNKPIQNNPFSAAGIEGYKIPEPFKLPDNIAAHFLQGTDETSFNWPSIAELNDEMFPFPWFPGEKENLLMADSIESIPVMYDGPAPSPPSSVKPSIPDITNLASSIIASIDKLFFVSYKVGSGSYREWKLIRVNLKDSMAHHPACLQDGRFLVEVYIPHPDDSRYNNVNQRFWLQYHSSGDIINPSELAMTHLVRPSDTSEALALRKGLVPFRLWMNLTHESTYIHGPFEFATMNSRKTRDRISLDDWKILASHKEQYDNDAPRDDLPTYSVHVDHGVISTHHLSAATSQLISATVFMQQVGEKTYW